MQDFSKSWSGALGLSLFFIVALTFLRRYKTSGRGKLPPGPTGLPVLGVLHKLSSRPWETFAQWKKEYGKSRCSYHLLLVLIRRLILQVPLSMSISRGRTL